MKPFFTFLLSSLTLLNAFSQSQPAQAIGGYGGSTLPNNGHMLINHNDSNINSGFDLIFDPTIAGDTVVTIVFNHGFGEWNPACYGKWIDHLVRQGYLIIFPRYQKDINPLSAGTYTDSAAYGIQKALDTLAAHPLDYPQPDLNRVIFMGHSFGGVETANLAHNYQLYNLPKPKGIFMACPGTNVVVAGQLPTYQYMDSSIKILTIVEQNDAVVDSSFSLTIFNGTPLVPTSHKNFIRAFRDSTGTPAIQAAHGESYSPDTSYSDGQFGSLIDLNTIPMCLANNITDATDEYVYWKLCDAFIDCCINGRGCKYAFGDTRQQEYRGTWSNGAPIRHLYVRPSAADSTIGDVWPGDANADGLVNNIDLLNIGLAYADTGTLRPGASNAWSAQPCPYWLNQYVTGENHNSGDCNGDGVVNAADTSAILLNYTSPRTFYPKPFTWPGYPRLALSFANSVIHPGDTAVMNFELGDSVLPATNIYGLVFSIKFDSTLIVPGTFISNYDSSWLGSANELLSLKKELRSYNQIDIGITRMDHTNRSGGGSIGQLSFTTVSQIPNGDTVAPLPVSISGIYAVDSFGNFTPLYNNGDYILTIQKRDTIADTTGIINFNTLQPQLALFPNPASGNVFLSASAPIESYIVYTPQGQEILRNENVKTQQANIHVDGWAQGLYILQATIGQQKVVKRFAVME